MSNVFIILEPNLDGNLIYYPGQTIIGYVEVSLPKDLVLQGLLIEIVGQGNTYLNTRISKDDATGTETYMNETKYLYGNSSGPHLKLKAGKHKFDFTHVLPENLPYSLDQPRGDISYHVEAFFDLPDSIDTQSFVPFSIIRRHDSIIQSSESQRPVTKEENYDFGCCSRQSESMNVSVTIPRSGYFCGEDIPIEINYENYSNKKIWSTLIRIIQQIVYQSDKSEKVDNKIMISSMIGESVKMHESKIINHQIKIPSNLLSSNKNFCKLITVSYHLQIELNEGPLVLDPLIIIPLTIGSKPTFSGILTTIAPNITVNPYARNGNVDLPPSFLEVTNLNATTKKVGRRTGQQSSIGWKI